MRQRPLPLRNPRWAQAAHDDMAQHLGTAQSKLEETLAHVCALEERLAALSAVRALGAGVVNWWGAGLRVLSGGRG